MHSRSPMLYWLETYGCQMNIAESAALENMLREAGWDRAEDEELARLVIINTCSVRISAENRAWGRIAHHAARKQRQRQSLLVTGCMAERLKAEMKKKQPAIDYVLGNFQKQEFRLVLDAIQKDMPPIVLDESPSYVFSPSHSEPGSFRAFIPIMHGCNNFCSYCIVPYVRGREVSRPPESILSEVKSLAANGVLEVTLLGQNVNSYMYKTPGAEDVDFPSLLTILRDELAGSSIRRIRFVSSHPKDLSDRTIQVLASSPIFARHIHLCLQHGSNSVLKAMNRKYTKEDYMELVRKIRAAIPGVSLSTDILVGFPGETEEDVEATISVMKEIGFAYAFMYFFNPREGTKAVLMEGQLPTDVKKARLARIIDTQLAISRQIMEGMTGSIVEALVEGPSRKKSGELLARTDQDMMVVFPAGHEKIGSFVNLRLLSLHGNTFRAEEVL